MRRLSFFTQILLLTIGLASAVHAAQETSLPAKLHPWGQFEPGARKVVLVKTETLDELGHVVGTSVAETITTLLDVNHDGVTLEVDPCVEVVGKHFEAEPQIVKQGFHGELISPNTKISDPIDGQIVVGTRTIPCKVQQVESTTSNGKIVTHLYYSPTIAPYLFKRESIITDQEGVVVSETTMEVTSLEMPWNVLGDSRNVFDTKTVQRTPKGTITTIAKISPEIPGGVVNHSSKEEDKNGRVVRRSTLELTDYDTEPDQDHLHRSKRAARHSRSKSSSRYGQ
jgi:hypothetical protein